jgi:hypothetical protein
VPPQGVQRLSWLISGGRTPARRRRQRRAEDALAVAKRILTAEFREQQLERAKVLRVLMRHVLTDMEEETGEAPLGQKRRVFQRVVAAVRTAERQKPKAGPTEEPPALAAAAKEKEMQPKAITEQEWQRRVQAYEQGVPRCLEEVGSLADMCATRRAALKEAKAYRAARRVHRLQEKRALRENNAKSNPAKKEARARKDKLKKRGGYCYEKRGGYGDVELVKDSDGKPQRKAQLRAAGSGAMTSLPTALLAVSKNRTLERRAGAEASG